MDQQKKNFPKKDGEKRFEKKFEKKFDKKPGEKKFGDKKFDKKPGERRFGDQKFGDKKPYAKKPFGDKKFDKKFDPKPQKPAGPSARDVALKALKAVARENAYAAQALDRELTAVKLSDDDRRLASSMFYFALENRLRIENVISARMQTKADPEVMDIIYLAAAQILFMDKIPDHAAVDEAVKQTRKARREGMTALVNGVLRGLIRARDAGELTLPDRDAEPEKYISEKHSVALPLVKRLIKAYGCDLTEEIAAWKPARHSDTIRANRMRMDNAAFEAWMTENQLSWEAAIVPGAYHVSGAGRIASHEGYRKGMFSIQGESSMLAAYAVGAKPGMQVLDACAAPGGKSCLIAEMMRGAGRVYAWDLHEHRVELIRAAAKRLELDNVRPQMHDAGKQLESMLLAMDAVLVDAPCSGLGVMGDKPDIKYRLTEETIDALVPVQKQILDACASYVRPGGLLVYSTCTILPEENEKQVEAFLARHPEFEPENDDKFLPEALRGQYKNGMIQILPCRDGIEGFFIARMRRKAGSYGI